MNVFNFIGNKIDRYCNETFVSLSRTDITLLAAMCKYCRSQVVKKGFFNHVYAYYIPEYEEDLEIAKQIFEKNGIHMTEHVSHILTYEGEKVLRMDYSKVLNKEHIRKELQKISKKYNSLYAVGVGQERMKLQKQIQDLRQKQK